MLPVDFPGTNITFAKPGDMTDEQCYALKAMVGTDGNGFPYTLTAWQPSYEDLQALNAGRPIMLQIIGGGMPPVALWTYDEETNPNV
ncbi:hypothetical protein GCM10027048_27900 [Hymenobacter coalescens]